MEIAIIGLASSGKTTVFNVIGDAHVDVSHFVGKENVSEIKVPDKRIDELARVFRPKKLTPAAIKFIDTLALKKRDVNKSQAGELEFSADAKQADAFVHVVRAFESAMVLHPEGSVDPERDIEIVELELKLNDMTVVEKRLERIEKDLRSQKKPELEREKAALIKCQKALNEEMPLRKLAFDETELKLIKNFRFLSQKPLLVLLNVSEGDIGTPKYEKIIKAHEGHFPVISLCAKVEMEISELPTEEQKTFMEALGITERARDLFIRKTYQTIRLISFFTVGEDEVRAWTISENTSAQKAAGKIHSDIERGFIRAETAGFADFVACGLDMVKARDTGKLRQEGKEYIVKDGDIINFKFSV